MEKEDQYTVTYFQSHGRGEFIRIALVYGKCDWKDNPINFQNWDALKPKTPSGVLPVL